MITNCVLWQGAFYATYEDEIEEWKQKVCGDPDTFLRIDLSEVDEKDELAILELIPEEVALWDDSRTLLIDYLQAWSSPSVKKLIKAIQDHECPYNIAFVQRENEPFKPVLSVLTEDARDKRVPYEPEGMAEWTISWLADHDVTMNSAVATRLAEYVGDDLDILESCVTAIAHAKSGEQIGWNDVVPYLQGEGIIPIYRLTAEIASGNKEEALNVLNKRLLPTLHPLQVMKLLENRFRSYVQIANLSDQEAREFLGNRGAFYTIKECRKLGNNRVLKCWESIAKAIEDLKGGSIMNQDDILSILVTRLTQQFNLAEKDKKRGRYS